MPRHENLSLINDQVIIADFGKNPNMYAIVTILNVFLYIPLSVAAIVMGITSPGNCDITDSIGINVAQYLINVGISSLILYVPNTIYSVLMWRGIESVRPKNIMFYTLLFVIFHFCWFIIGVMYCLEEIFIVSMKQVVMLCLHLYGGV